MPFADSFASLMSDRGIPLTPSAVPERDIVDQSLNSIQTWLAGLDTCVREGFDEGSAEAPVCFVLGSPEINVAPGIPGVLEAFDTASGKRLSEMLLAAQECLELADTGIA
ncbi:hypothetical protein [Corallococcus sp. CA053C]|uniref:hypothetical protein n=1 Tax=Corallococcus sp. CA053C TaxID=2316732 RepID=UPI0011C48614|nr:hypothetical protein [Corallococcus sp. CA053C]